MSSADGWFTLTILRSKPTLESMKDECGHLMCGSMDMFFEGGKPFKSGVVVDALHDGMVSTYLIRASLRTSVSDERTIKQVLGINGAS